MKKTAIYLFSAFTLGACSGNSDSWDGREKTLIRSGEDVMHVFTILDQSETQLLRTPCKDLTEQMLSSEEYGILARKMVATVTSPEQDGVGIAGPQVGISRRIVAVMRLDKEGDPFEVYPNIRITATRGEMECGAEGCLSVPGKRGEVARYRDIDITYTSTKTLKDTCERIQGFTAVIFQHECDHLDGVIYTDKAVSVRDREE